MQCHLPSSTALQVHVVVYQKNPCSCSEFPYYFIQCSCFRYNSCTNFFTHTGFVHSPWWTIFSSLADERRASKPSWWARGVSYSSLCWSGNFMGLCHPDTSCHPTSRSWGLFSILTLNNFTKLDTIKINELNQWNCTEISFTSSIHL